MSLESRLVHVVVHHIALWVHVVVLDPQESGWDFRHFEVQAGHCNYWWKFVCPRTLVESDLSEAAAGTLTFGRRSLHGAPHKLRFQPQ